MPRPAHLMISIRSARPVTVGLSKRSFNGKLNSTRSVCAKRPASPTRNSPSSKSRRERRPLEPKQLLPDFYERLLGFVSGRTNPLLQLRARMQRSRRRRILLRLVCPRIDGFARFKKSKKIFRGNNQLGHPIGNRPAECFHSFFRANSFLQTLSSAFLNAWGTAASTAMPTSPHAPQSIDRNSVPSSERRRCTNAS